MADRLPSIKAEDFVTLWQQKGPDYFTGLGYSTQAVRSRASSLRKLGVPLKEWPLSRRKTDINMLKTLAEQALSNSAESLDDTP